MISRENCCFQGSALIGVRVSDWSHKVEGLRGSDTFNPPWTLKRVRLFIEREFGVQYSEVHVWRLLGQMGFSSQRQERRALERDDAAIEHWKKHVVWP